MRDFDDIVIVRGADGEGQSVVIPFGVLYLMLIFEVLDGSSFSEPSFPVLLLLLHGEYTWHHAIIEQRIRLPHVDDIELHSHIFGRVGDSEVKPLCVALGIHIILQNQVVFVLIDPEDCQQIA